MNSIDSENDPTLRQMNHLGERDPSTFLERCAAHLSGMVQVTSFGPSGMMIMDILHRLGVRIPVVFIDTLHHFDETLRHVERAQQRYDLDLHVVRCPEASTADEFAARFGPALWRSDPERFGQLTKVEPHRRALHALGAETWINGRRRSQGDLRRDIEPLERDGARWKLNPLAYVGYEEMWAYLQENDVPYNPLLDEGYKSVGDYVTTAAVKADGDERSGRWSGSGQSECGLHTSAVEPEPGQRFQRAPTLLSFAAGGAGTGSGRRGSGHARH
jgi:phosphoadenosine phosphosulfate reductase